MGSYRTRRFLIDRIDERLGSVEKEIKFDRIAIGVGVILTIVGILIFCLCGIERPRLYFIGVIFVMAGIAIMYVLTKELISDKRKAKK